MFEIRKARREDAYRIKQLTDQYISKDFYEISFLEQKIDDPDNLIYVCQKEDKEIVAYIYLFLDSLKNVCDVLHIPEKIRKELPYYEKNKETKVCSYKTISIEKEFRSQGIHDQFLEHMDALLKKTDIAYSIMTALKRVDGMIPAHRGITKDRFKPVIEVEHPWIHEKSYCPYCKKDYCECNGMVYIKWNKQE